MLVMVVTLYTTRVVLRVLGVSDYGIFNVVCGFVTMFGFLNTSLSNGIQRFYNFELGKDGATSVTRIYNCALAVQIALAVGILIFAESFGLWYLNNKLVIEYERLFAALWIFQFAVIQLLFVVVSIPYSAAIIAYEKMDYYALVSVLDAVLKLLIVLILPFVQFDKLVFYGFLLVLTSVLNFLLYYIYCKIKFPDIKWENRIEKGVLINILTFSGWNICGTSAYMLKNQGTALVLNYFFGTLVNAAYGISAQVMNAIRQFASNIIISFRPQLVQSYASKNYSRTRSLMFSMTKITYLMIFTLSIPIMLEMDYILHIWLGNVPDYTVAFSRLAIVSMLLSNFNTPVVQVVHAVGNLKVFQIITSVIIVSIIPFSYLAFKLGGNPNMIYWVTIIVVIVNQMACLIVLRRLFDYSYVDYIKMSIIPCVLVSITTPLLPIFITHIMVSSFVRFTIVTLSSVLMSLVMSYVFGITPKEKEYLKSMINNGIAKKNSIYHKK